MSTIIMVTLFTCCDPGVGYNKVIENNSDHDLKILVYPDTTKRFSFLFEKDSFIVYRHSQTSIANFSSLGQTKEFEDCDTYTDSIVVKIIDNDTLQLRLNLKDNSIWTFNRLKKSFGDGGECECRIEIGNENIQ